MASATLTEEVYKASTTLFAAQTLSPAPSLTPASSIPSSSKVYSLTITNTGADDIDTVRLDVSPVGTAGSNYVVTAIPTKQGWSATSSLSLTGTDLISWNATGTSARIGPGGTSTSTTFTFTATSPSLAISYTWTVTTVDDNATPVAVVTNLNTNVESSPPTVSSITTLDRDTDGSIDAATVVFSESVDDSTFTTSTWTIGGGSIDAIATLTTADDNTIQLQINTAADEISGTDVKDVVYTPGAAADIAGNLLGAVATADVTEVDGALPQALTTANSSTSTITMTFSEDVVSFLPATNFRVTSTPFGSVANSVTVASETNFWHHNPNLSDVHTHQRYTAGVLHRGQYG